MARHHNFRLITPNSYPFFWGRREVEREGSPGLQIHSYPIHFLHFKRTSTRWIMRSRDLGFQAFQPDIIHVENESHAWITCQALLYRRLFAPRAKVVILVCDNLTPNKQGTKGRLLEHLSKVNRPQIDMFICVNRAAREILLATGIPDEKLTVLSQVGIDADVFYPYSVERRKASRVRLGISDTEFAVGFVGRLVGQKGVLDLLEAVGKLHAAAARRTPVLVLAGKGDMEETLRSRSAKLGVKLVILPPCRYQEVTEVMNTLDVFVLPSQSRSFWKEQFGRVTIEAMACGVPMIGSDCGEIPNVIGDAGLVFHEGDTEQLFSCLQSCYENETLRISLREMGLKRVLEYFTNLVIARRTLQIYDQLRDREPEEEAYRVAR